jgi:hypothetical protein
MEYLFSLEKTCKNVAYFYAAIGYIAQGFMFIVFKVVCQVISPFHALMMRAFTLLLINCIFLRISKQDPYIKNPKRKLLLIQYLKPCSNDLSSRLATVSLQTIVLSIFQLAR